MSDLDPARAFELGTKFDKISLSEDPVDGLA
jgi:hypothetical protein